jgi:hypothetical protein
MGTTAVVLRPAVRWPPPVAAAAALAVIACELYVRDAGLRHKLSGFS